MKDKISFLRILPKNDRYCDASGNRDRDSGAVVVGDLDITRHDPICHG